MKLFRVFLELSQRLEQLHRACVAHDELLAYEEGCFHCPALEAELIHVPEELATPPDLQIAVHGCEASGVPSRDHLSLSMVEEHSNSILVASSLPMLWRDGDGGGGTHSESEVGVVMASGLCLPSAPPQVPSLRITVVHEQL